MLSELEARGGTLLTRRDTVTVSNASRQEAGVVMPVR
jgi:hypothetical protein